MEEITTSGSTTPLRFRAGSARPVGAAEMVKKTLSLPKTNCYRPRELSEYKPKIVQYRTSYLTFLIFIITFPHRLEAEIEEARLKAKEEMMQGIQVAKEMAQKELSEQKGLYENRIRALERELVSRCMSMDSMCDSKFSPVNLMHPQEEESERKREQELDKKRVVCQIEQLHTAKTLLEHEVNSHKRRLQMEAQATRQVQKDQIKSKLMNLSKSQVMLLLYLFM